MKKIQTIAACVAALALIGVATLKSAESGQMTGKAIIRTVHGKVEYSVTGEWKPLHPNMELDGGASIRTSADSYADVSVNNSASVVRITQNTTMQIKKMNRIGVGRDKDTDTMLDLETGSILGNVKKLSGNSRYEIQTPRGVAGIRGTDFAVTVIRLPDGKFQVTFTSVTGTVIVSAVVDNATIVKILRDGQSWTPGDGDVIPTPLQLILEYKNIIEQLINQLLVLPPPTPIIHPYNGNGTPTGIQPSTTTPTGP